MVELQLELWMCLRLCLVVVVDYFDVFVSRIVTIEGHAAGAAVG
jgi:hypothetical protein